MRLKKFNDFEDTNEEMKMKFFKKAMKEIDDIDDDVEEDEASAEAEDVRELKNGQVSATLAMEFTKLKTQKPERVISKIEKIASDCDLESDIKHSKNRYEIKVKGNKADYKKFKKELKSTLK